MGVYLPVYPYNEWSLLSWLFWSAQDQISRCASSVHGSTWNNNANMFRCSLLLLLLLPFYFFFFFFSVWCGLVIVVVSSGRWTAPSGVGRWLFHDVYFLENFLLARCISFLFLGEGDPDAVKFHFTQHPRDKQTMVLLPGPIYIL